LETKPIFSSFIAKPSLFNVWKLIANYLPLISPLKYNFFKPVITQVFFLDIKDFAEISDV
jgi:hypothetical protein